MSNLPEINSLHFCPECRQVLIWIDGDGYCDNVNCEGDSYPDEEAYRE